MWCTVPKSPYSLPQENQIDSLGSGRKDQAIIDHLILLQSGIMLPNAVKAVQVGAGAERSLILKNQTKTLLLLFPTLRAANSGKYILPLE